MISTEDRQRKPYVLPVQYIPYKAMRDTMVCELANKIIVTGFTKTVPIGTRNEIQFIADY